MKNKYIVFFDFDKTITTIDVIDDMLPRYSGNKQWMAFEKKWQDGEIGSRACLNGQIRGLKIDKKGLNNYLAGVKLDPYFKKLLKLLDNIEAEYMILSDDFGYIIKNILNHNKISKIKLFANKLEFSKRGLIPKFPLTDKKCRICAHCKTKSLLASVDTESIIIYIGDGRSDICPAQYANIVFAKDALLKLCREEKMPCVPFDTLKDVYVYCKKRLIC
jgi:2,3-diketo-5-methylthio-1-phosphopentane phosphatase